MNPFISDALAQAQGSQQGGDFMGIIMLVVMFGAFYFLLMRPQMKRQKEHKKMVEALQKNDEVQTVGGMMGKITEVGENFVKVEVSDNVIVTVRRSSVEAVMPKGTLKEI